MPKHPLSHSHPFGEHVHTLEELNHNDHLVPCSEEVAKLPDSNRETWHKEESDPYPKQPEEKPE